MVSQKCPNVGDRDNSHFCHTDHCVCADHLSTGQDEINCERIGCVSRGSCDSYGTYPVCLLHIDIEKVHKNSCKQCSSRSVFINPMLALILGDPCELRNKHMTIMNHFLVLYCWHFCFLLLTTFSIKVDLSKFADGIIDL